MKLKDYVYSNHRSFEECSFNRLDALVFCQLAYSRLELAPEKTIRDCFKAEYFDRYFSDCIADDENRELLTAASASRRFRNIKIRDIYTKDENNEQLAIVVFELERNLDFVAFRGTDGTLVGWKEDCELAIRDKIPSQIDALKYIEDHYSRGRRRLYLGGHSKGGNLAVYSAAFCQQKIQNKIERVFNFDGPGFTESVNNYISKQTKLAITRIVPETSIIGMLLNNDKEYLVISSDESGIAQHDIGSWEIQDNDFVYLDETSSTSKYIEKTLSAWLGAAEQSEKEAFVDTIFGILEKHGYTKVADLNEITPMEILALYEEVQNLNESTKAALKSFASQLAKEAFRSIVK